eukprot:m.243215 g.243215  ORF g.243215 m.243215 type:complete len:1927 (+) comp14196_c0_seq1:71-5851(+)
MFARLRVDDVDDSDAGPRELAVSAPAHRGASADSGDGWERTVKPTRDSGSHQAPQSLSKKAEKFAAVLWKYKVSECNNESYHDFKACRHWHSRVNDIDRRRDPRRHGQHGPISTPPWAYTLADCQTKNETLFHPEKYKTDICEKFASGKGCHEQAELCPFRHITSEGDDLDVDVNQVTTWRPQYFGNIDWDSYLKLMLTYKVEGPCTNECSQHPHTRIRCPKWHKPELDQRIPVDCNESGWLPVNLMDLPNKSAHSYDPRIYKSKICDRFPGCSYGIYCTFAHSERERDMAVKFRDQLRDYLLAHNRKALAPPPAAAAPAMALAVPAPHGGSAAASPALAGTIPVPLASHSTGVLMPLQANRPRRLVQDNPETVCQICWNATATGGCNGTRIPRTNPAAKNCTRCGQLWQPAVIHKSTLTNRYVQLRPPPDNMTPNTKLILCADRRAGRTCPRGGSCTFPHSDEELAEWVLHQGSQRNEDNESMNQFVARVSMEKAYKERPAPPGTMLNTTYKLCHHHPCKFGRACNYPHTDAEKREWDERQRRMVLLTQRVTAVPAAPLATEQEAHIPSMKRALAGVSMNVLEGGPDATIFLYPDADTVISVVVHADTETFLDRVGVHSPTGEFRLMAVEQGEYSFPIITEGPVQGDCQAITKLGPGNDVICRIAFCGSDSGSHVASLIIEINAHIFLRQDVTATIVPLPRPQPVAPTSARAATEYPIPGELDAIIKQQLAETMSRDAYRASMHAFAFAEEHAILGRLPLCTLMGQPAVVAVRFQIADIADAIVAADNECLVFVQLSDRADELLVVSPGDRAVLCFQRDDRPDLATTLGTVDLAPRSCLILRCPRACIDHANPNGHTRVHIMFELNRARFLAMHMALDAANLDQLFPQEAAPLPAPALVPTFDTQLDDQQKLFVSQILNGAASQAPFLLVGPGQSGKTRAVVECVKQLSLNPNYRILIAVHRDGPAINLMKNHLIPFHQQGGVSPLLAVPQRQLSGVPDWLAPHTAATFPEALLSQSRVVVTTAANAHLLGVAGQPLFTHVIVDDASQISEIEALYAIGLGHSTILVGHPHASAPACFSALGLRGLGDPIINRLSEVYTQSSLASTHVQHFGVVYQGNSDIVKVLSPDLLYSDFVQCVDEQGNPARLFDTTFPVIYCACDGEDSQLNDFPGFVNEKEVQMIEAYVAQLQSIWPAQWGPFDPSQIAIVVPYAVQAVRLRSALFQRQLRVVVGLPSQILDNVYRAVFVSTVRTWALRSERLHGVQRVENTGLLEDPYTLSMIFSRARSLLVVIGHPATTLTCTQGAAQKFWIQFIDSCAQKSTFFGPGGEALQQEMQSIQQIAVEGGTGLQLQPTAPLQQRVRGALEKYARVLWSYRIAPCMNSAPHAAEACWNYHGSDWRRDPRRIGSDNTPINFPPWAYSLAECANETERQYHPDNYKMKNCSRLLINGRCELGDRCNFRHVNPQNEDEDYELTDLRQWWADMTAIAREEYFSFVMHYKRAGPCSNCTTQETFTQCEYYHGDLDRCPQPALAFAEWTPPLNSLTPFSKLFDPRYFKLKLCREHPVCPLGRRCISAHGVVELAAVRSYLRELRLSLLLKDDILQRLLEKLLVPFEGITTISNPHVVANPLNALVAQLQSLPQVVRAAEPQAPAAAPVAAQPAPQSAQQAAPQAAPQAPAQPLAFPDAHALQHQHNKDWTEAPDIRASMYQQLQAGVPLPELLFDAVHADSADAIRVLVFEQQADVNWMYTNAQRSCAFTLLHFACDGGLVQAVRCLVRLGASRELIDSSSKNPMTIAFDGMTNRAKQAQTAPEADRDALDARSKACHKCMLALLEEQPAPGDEREEYFALLRRSVPDQFQQQEPQQQAPQQAPQQQQQQQPQQQYEPWQSQFPPQYPPQSHPMPPPGVMHMWQPEQWQGAPGFGQQ